MKRMLAGILAMSISTALMAATPKPPTFDGKRISQDVKVLASDAYADEVRAQERFYQQNGINSVPAVIINERHLISGGQPPEVFEQALRQIISGA